LKIDRRRLAFLIVGIACGLVAGWVRSRTPGNDGYVANVVVTVFAVLAGFLSVVLNMVLMTRPPVFKSKQSQTTYSDQVRSRLVRHSAIFYVYLAILISVFFSELSRVYWPGTSRLLEIAYCALSAAGLVWSLAVPATLAKLHADQITLAETHRKP